MQVDYHSDGDRIVRVLLEKRLTLCQGVHHRKVVIGTDDGKFAALAVQNVEQTINILTLGGIGTIIDREVGFNGLDILAITDLMGLVAAVRDDDPGRGIEMRKVTQNV